MARCAKVTIVQPSLASPEFGMVAQTASGCVTAISSTILVNGRVGRAMLESDIVLATDGDILKLDGGEEGNAGWAEEKTTRNVNVGAFGDER